MTEKDYDSSFNEYEEIKSIDNNELRSNWNMALGLQMVDNLKPSKYLEHLLNENISGNKSLIDIRNDLESYYTEKKESNLLNIEELECDFVSTRIVELLEEKTFDLSVDYFKYVHKYLFQDIYEFAGEFRVVDISKNEKILNGDTVSYGSFNMLNDSIIYDISLEKEKNYKDSGIVSIINGVTKFSSDIWQVHPFREGNTRTVAVFIQKYLVNLGYDVNNELFKENSIYYRNALVRSCYFNKELNMTSDLKYLCLFYENLLLGKNHELNSKDLVV